MGRRASAKARAIAAFVEDQLRQTNFAEQPAHVRDRRRARHRRRLYRPIALSRRAIGASAISELATRRSAFSAVQKSAIAE